MSIKPVSDLYLITYEDGTPYKTTRDAKEAVDAIGAGFKVEEFVSLENHRAAMLQAKSLASINPAPALCSLSKTGEVLHTNSPVITDEGGATIIDVKYPFLRACSSICLVL